MARSTMTLHSSHQLHLDPSASILPPIGKAPPRDYLMLFSRGILEPVVRPKCLFYKHSEPTWSAGFGSRLGPPELSVARPSASSQTRKLETVDEDGRRWGIGTVFLREFIAWVQIRYSSVCRTRFSLGDEGGAKQ